MTRLLVRSYRPPFRAATPTEALERDWFGGNNNGNLLFSEGAARILSVGGVEVTFQDLDQRLPDPAQVNEEFDHVVLPFANAFRPSFRGPLRRYVRFIEQLEIPVTVLGVGAQSDIDFGFDSLAEVDRLVTRFTRAVLERSPSIAVRGAFTASYLRHLGFDEVEVIGCPSMFSRGPELPTRGLEVDLDESSRIALNLTPKLDLAPRIADELTARYPRLTYFPQGKRELEMLLWGGRPAGAPGATPSLGDLEHPLFREAHVHVHPETWIAEMATYDFSVGTRIHGNVTACLAGTPAHLLAADSRTRELAEYFQIPYTRLSDLPSPLDLRALTKGADYTAVGRGHRARFDHFISVVESHGLAHIWQPGATSTWDEQTAGLRLPGPAVIDRDTPRAVLTRMGDMRREHDRQLTRLRKRLDRQHQQIAELTSAVEAGQREELSGRRRLPFSR